MAETKLVGQNYSTPDIRAKVTGRARYAEDFRAQGMLHARLLLSPYAHARVSSIDASAAKVVRRLTVGAVISFLLCGGSGATCPIGWFWRLSGVADEV